MKKTKTAGLMFVCGGVVFLVLSAIQYFSGRPTAAAFFPIGIAAVIIGVAIGKSGEKH